MRLFAIPSSLAGFLLLNSAGTPAAEGTRQPVVIELFTSEGCSSCPPADALLQKFDREQPVPGALMIVLSEHVDYWDGLGWKDPFSSTLFTRRQEAYVRSFHLTGAYTPQVVIDGAFEAVGSDARQIQDAVRQSIKSEKRQVKISEVSKNNRGVPTVHVQVDPSAKAPVRGARLMLALAENAAVSDVLRGENRGRQLGHVAVVRSLVESGRLDRAGTFSADIPLTGELGHWEGKRLVAFIQYLQDADTQDSRIEGAAFRLLSPIAPN